MAEAAAIEKTFPWEVRPVPTSHADSAESLGPVIDASAEFAFAPMREPRGSRPSLVALAVSLAAHGAMLAALTLYVGSPRPPDEAVEIPVEIVAEIPQESPPPAPEASPTPQPPPIDQTPPPPVEPPPPPPPVEPPPPPPVEPPPPPPVEAPPPPPPVEAPPPPPVEAPPPPPPPAVAPPPPPPVEPPPPPKPEPPPPPKPEPPPAPKAAARPQPKPQPQPKPALARPAAAAEPAAAPKAAQPKADVGAYRASLYARIYGVVRYPAAARAQGVSGVAVVNFSLDAAGQVTSAGLAQSSGDATLDADAVATVRRASPLPAPPEGAPRAYAVPIRYRLR